MLEDTLVSQNTEHLTQINHPTRDWKTQKIHENPLQKQRNMADLNPLPSCTRVTAQVQGPAGVPEDEGVLARASDPILEYGQSRRSSVSPAELRVETAIHTS